MKRRKINLLVLATSLSAATLTGCNSGSTSDGAASQVTTVSSAQLSQKNTSSQAVKGKLRDGTAGGLVTYKAALGDGAYGYNYSSDKGATPTNKCFDIGSSLIIKQNGSALKGSRKFQAVYDSSTYASANSISTDASAEYSLFSASASSGSDSSKGLTSTGIAVTDTWIYKKDSNIKQGTLRMSKTGLKALSKYFTSLKEAGNDPVAKEAAAAKFFNGCGDSVVEGVHGGFKAELTLDLTTSSASEKSSFTTKAAAGLTGIASVSTAIAGENSSSNSKISVTNGMYNTDDGLVVMSQYENNLSSCSVDSTTGGLTQGCYDLQADFSRYVTAVETALTSTTGQLPGILPPSVTPIYQELDNNMNIQDQYEDYALQRGDSVSDKDWDAAVKNLKDNMLKFNKQSNNLASAWFKENSLNSLLTTFSSSMSVNDNSLKTKFDSAVSATSDVLTGAANTNSLKDILDHYCLVGQCVTNSSTDFSGSYQDALDYMNKKNAEIDPMVSGIITPLKASVVSLAQSVEYYGSCGNDRIQIRWPTKATTSPIKKVIFDGQEFDNGVSQSISSLCSGVSDGTPSKNYAGYLVTNDGSNARDYIPFFINIKHNDSYVNVALSQAASVDKFSRFSPNTVIPVNLWGGWDAVAALAKTYSMNEITGGVVKVDTYTLSSSDDQQQQYTGCIGSQNTMGGAITLAFVPGNVTQCNI